MKEYVWMSVEKEMIANALKKIDEILRFCLMKKRYIEMCNDFIQICKDSELLKNLNFEIPDELFEYDDVWEQDCITVHYLRIGISINGMTIFELKELLNKIEKIDDYEIDVCSYREGVWIFLQPNDKYVERYLRKLVDIYNKCVKESENKSEDNYENNL